MAALLTLLALTILAGSICGIVAVIRIHGLRRDIERLRKTVVRLESGAVQSAFREEPRVAEPPRYAERAEPPKPPQQPVKAVSPEYIPSEPIIETARAKALPSLPSIEMMLGTKAIWWVGIVMSLVGLAFLLKYAYDNNWIGPQGRLVIGVIAGCASLVAGERFRRKGWRIPFEVMTGGGIAAFYLCVYFAFQVYHVTGASTSMAAAVVVTLFAIAMAVGHDAISIAILGVAGGFLSPLLLSTGENRPYGLFTYIAVLNCVALGSAYFRRWRLLNLLCYAGTVLIYTAWHAKFYRPDQLAPALVFTSLFYLMFLLIPLVHSLVRRVPETYEGLALIAANAAFSLHSYYSVLFPGHRQVLGFVVIAQALLVFLLFKTYSARLSRDVYTAQCLLFIALALALLAVPIQLRLYGLPIVWAVEGTAFIGLGIWMRQPLGRAAGVAGLLLAAAGLLYRLPLHHARYVPVFNVPFLSWALVIALTTIGALIFLKSRERFIPEEAYAAHGLALLALALFGLLTSCEAWQFFQFRDVAGRATHQFNTLLLLWTLISVIVAKVAGRWGGRRAAPVAWICFTIAGVVCLKGLQAFSFPSPWLAFNAGMLPKLVFVAALWWASRPWHLDQRRDASLVFEMAGHALLVVLVGMELNRWSFHTAWLSHRMGLTLISAAWALQAFALIWFGLASRVRARRIAGFALFGLTIAKVLFFDTSGLDRVYQIVSWLGSGIALLTAAFFYQRYLHVLLGEQAPKKGSSA